MVNGKRGSRGILIKEPAAILEGGRRDGFAYYVSELHRMVALEAEFGGRFCYRPTDRTTIHPRTFGEVSSAVWEYVPEWDARAPQPPPPPTWMEALRCAIAMCGRRGGQLREIVNNLPPALTEGNWPGRLAVAAAPAVWWLVQQGVVEANPNDAWYETRYRTVSNAQVTAARAPAAPADRPGYGPPSPVDPGLEAD